MTGYRRELSGAAKAMVIYNELRPPFVIQLVLEGDGDPDPDDLVDALDATTEANPGSALVLEESDDPIDWIAGPAPTLTCIDAPNFTATDDEDAPFLRWPMDAESGPTCELVYVKGKNKNYLIFRALHAVMDGQGTILWVKDFLRCLRGEDPIGHPSTMTAERLLEDRELEARALTKADAIHPFGKPDLTTKGDYHWQRVQLPTPLSSGQTGQIAVAIARQARSLQDGIVRFALPTDLRHYAPSERTTANMFNMLAIDIPPDATAEGIGMAIIRLLYKHEGKRPIGLYQEDRDRLASLAIYRVKGLWDQSNMHNTGLYAASAGLSHLGKLTSAALSAPAFTSTSAFFVPLVGETNCVVHLNGFDDHAELTVGLSDRFGPVSALATLLQDELLEPT